MTVSFLVGLLGFFIYLNGNLQNRHPYKLYAWQLIACAGHYMQSQCLIFFDVYQFYRVFTLLMGMDKSNEKDHFRFYINLMLIAGYMD